MRQNRRKQRRGNDCGFAARRVLTSEKKKNLEEKVEEEIRAGLAALKEPLNQFEKETGELLAGLEIPPLSYFTALVHDNLTIRQKASWREILSFSLIAVTFFSLIGYLLHHGYLLPVAGFFALAALLLPTVLLFAEEN